MTTPPRPHRRTLAEQLGSWAPTALAELLVTRPDLAGPPAPADAGQLAERAQHEASLAAAVEALPLPHHRLLQVVVCCPRDCRLEVLVAALPEGVAPADVEPVLVDLERRALVWRHAGRLHQPGALGHVVPTTLGLPLARLARDQTVEYLRASIALVRAEAGGEPSAAVPPAPPQARKADLVAELSALLGAPGVVDAVLAGAPADAAELARRLAAGRPVVLPEHPLHHSRYVTAHYRRLPTYWLYERGLLLPTGDGAAVQPREAGLALRGGRPVDDLALAAPPLADLAVDEAEVERAAGAAAGATLAQLADLLDGWADAPQKELKSGGLGVIAVKAVAARLDVDVEHAARLVELAHLAGLVERRSVATRARYQSGYDSFVHPSAQGEAWLAAPEEARWWHLAGAWLRAERWPSATGRRDGDDPPVPVMSPQYARTAPARRRDVLSALVSLPPGRGASADALVAHVYWQRPQPWLERGGGPPSEAIDGIRAEAELLGLVAHGAPSAGGRALAAGDEAAAVAAFEAARPAVATTFTLQADLTATVVGDLDRSTLAELRLLADVESTGGATTFRFSEASLRRAFDAGRDQATVLAFLERHADRGVPGPLAYLVGDVARRHGHLQVAAAATVVTSDDVAVLADACSHRRAKKLGLRLLAPTVAVSGRPPDAVVAGLRQAGFLPRRSDEEGVPKVGLGRRQPDDGAATPDRWREPFAARAVRQRAPLDRAGAVELAEALLRGAPAAPVPPAADDHAGRALPHLEGLLERAARELRVLALGVLDDGDAPEDVVLVATSCLDGVLVGLTLEGDDEVEVPFERIASVLDVGSFADLAFDRPRRRRR